MHDGFPERRSATRERPKLTPPDILLLAGREVGSDDTPPSGRERAPELIDALLALAARYDFVQADALRAMLADGIDAERTKLLADVALNVVPQQAVLDVVRASGLYVAGLSGPDGHGPES